MINALIKIFHGGPLDGNKKMIGIVLHMGAKLLKSRNPEIADIVEQLGDFIMGWGVASDAVKGTEK